MDFETLQGANCFHDHVNYFYDNLDASRDGAFRKSSQVLSYLKTVKATHCDTGARMANRLS